jgi:type II secretory pathway predicted ATPase ExeA
MKLGVLAALDQRIGLRYTMAAMTDKETGSYLRHHLALARTCRNAVIRRPGNALKTYNPS